MSTPASAWPQELYRHWYAVARAAGIGRQPQAITLLDRHFAIARDGAGGWLALEDRCPHRQVALSAGCVRDGALQCPYHGWRFDAGGRLCALPGHDPQRPLPAFQVPSFPLREHDGLLWLRPSAEGVPTLPALALARDPGQRRLLWQAQWRGHVVDVMENVLDALHTHYVHAGWLRRDSRRRPVTVRLTVPAAGQACADYRGADSQSGLVWRLFESRRSGERAHFHLPASTCLEYTYANGAAVWVGLHFSPLDARTTRVVASLHVHRRWAPRWAVRLLLGPLLAHVGRQDAAILAAQQDNLDRFGDGRRPLRVQGDVMRPLLEDWWLHGRAPDPARARELTLWL